MTTKYRFGITGGVSGGMTKRPKPVTCTDVEGSLCPEGDLNPLSHGAMSRLLAQQRRSKWVWAASCYPFARVNAGRCSHGGNRLLIWVRWHRPPDGQRVRRGSAPWLHFTSL